MLTLESANRAAKTLIRQFNGEDINWDKEYTSYMALGVETFRTYVNAWYDNKLPTIFFYDTQPESLKKQICSVLAGYVWDEDSPTVFVNTVGLSQTWRRPAPLWQRKRKAEQREKVFSLR